MAEAGRGETTACNLCGGVVVRSRDLRWTKNGYDIARCPTCTLVFRFDLPDRDDIAAIYGPDYFSRDEGDTGGQGYVDYVADAPLHRAAARARLQILSPHSRVGRILDVGAAAGFFVAEANAAGWDAAGVDVSADMVAWGRRELGAHLVHQPFDAYAGDENAYDAITMWDYLEHSCDPRAELEQARRSLRPNGIIALSTGDVGSLVARLSGSRWHLLTPRHHNFFFDRTTLHRYLGAAGFDVLELRHRGGTYSLEYLAHKARTLVDVRPVRAAASLVGASRWRSIAVHLNLFDILTVIAIRR